MSGHFGFSQFLAGRTFMPYKHGFRCYSSWTASCSQLSEAQTFCVNIGVEKIVYGGGIFHYYLTKVDLRDQQVSLLSRLQDTRF
jgi:hypothetical protein